MQYQEAISALVKQHVADQALRQKSTSKYSVRSLQTMLYKLGFGAELNWAKFQADGDYGNGTTKAVSAFLRKNNLPGDGSIVSNEVAQLMLNRLSLAPALVNLHQALASNQLAPYQHGTEQKAALQDLQTMLNALGYGEKMNFAAVGAHGTYDQGTAAALQAYAATLGIAMNGTKLTANIAKPMLDNLTKGYGAGWLEAQTEVSNARRQSDLTVEDQGNAYIVRNTFVRARFRKHSKGYFDYGSEAAADFINLYSGTLKKMGLTDSAIRVLLPVSDHEGKLNGVNTWDNSYLSFGMFQWTLGVGSNAGELPALLKRLKSLRSGSTAFTEYFANHGLDVDPATTETTGYLLHNGQRIKSVASKEMFRQPEWGFRFWHAGLDPRMQVAEILHAHSRLYSFYHNKGYRPLQRFYIDELVSSEYGVSLLLDHHVNRPGHLMSVAKTRDAVGVAMKLAGLENTDPKTWTTEHEMKLLKAYIPLRTQYKMTHGQQRADNITRLLQAGKLSGERGSFVLQAKTRGMAASPLPQGMTEADYPMIDPTEYENRVVPPMEE